MSVSEQHVRHPLRTEALWAIEKLGHRLDGDDSALLLVSWNQLDRNLAALRDIWDHPRALHAVAVKTQPHVGVLKHIVAAGFGLEAASWEEVNLARKAGCPPEATVFDSPVKRPSEISDCAVEGPGTLVNANCLAELPRLAPYARELGIGLRINPMVDTASPELFAVSGDDSKFGEPIAHREQIMAAIRRYPVTGLHVHPSSSMAHIDAAVHAVRTVVGLAQDANSELQRAGVPRRIERIDVGGGLAPESPSVEGFPRMQAYVDALREQVPQLWGDYELVTEFGQWVHAHTGYAVSGVEYVVERAGKQVAFVHLGADFLLRDVYGQPRDMSWLAVREGMMLPGASRVTDVAGPLCFAGDYPARGVLLPDLREGDMIAMLGTGANAYGLWSRHTSRTIPATLAVDYAKRTIEELSPRTNPFL